ncbi:hypothetical protein Dimus_008862 [Dionaea muscipula]
MCCSCFQYREPRLDDYIVQCGPCEYVVLDRSGLFLKVELTWILCQHVRPYVDGHNDQADAFQNEASELVRISDYRYEEFSKNTGHPSDKTLGKGMMVFSVGLHQVLE